MQLGYSGLPRAASAVHHLGPVLAFVLLVPLLAPLSAQATPAPASPAPATPTPSPASTAAPTAQEPTAPVPGQLTLATIVPATAKLKCYASPLAAEFDDTLAQNAVVAVGRSENGYRQILMPLGPVGYVHKKFATAPLDGKVRSQGTAVSFRYRAQTNEAPTAQLSQDTELLVVGELPEWWRVRTATVEAWLPEAEVQVAPAITPELQAGYDATVKAAQQEPQAWLDALKKQQELQQQVTAARLHLQQVQQVIDAEMQKPAASQDFAAADAQLQALQQTLPADAELQQAFAYQQNRVTERRMWLTAMKAVAEPIAPPKDLPVVAVEPDDPMQHFNAIGYMRWERSLAGPGRYVVEQGGKTLYVVTCNSDRYDLALFVNREVALIGPRRRPNTDSLRVLDIEKLAVLSAAAK